MAFRTDLAIEETQARGSVEGVKSVTTQQGELTVHTVDITCKEAAQVIGKAEGRYITVELPPFSGNAQNTQEEIEGIAIQLQALLPKEGVVLVVGLGNRDITPDALGPMTAGQILATRHITGELAKAAGLEHLRGVAVLAPGVLGQTGVETGEIVAAVVQEIKPCAVIVVDALAARSMARLGSTVQFSNTGISPGAGVFNKRKELCQGSLGIPVIAVGIPTVVDATTLAGDLLKGQAEENRELFEPRGEKMMITPREIDLVIERGAKFLSLVINRALQPQMSLDDITYLVS